MSPRRGDRIRYAVVGLGHIAQVAILPGLQNTRNSTIAAVVSGDEEKLRKLGKEYDAPGYSYEQYEDCLKKEDIDAVFIALPNDRHREYTVRAAHAGVHVLCEKPMAVTSEECVEMIDACENNDVKLMIAYRLHFEAANLEAIDIAQSGRLGDLRYFNSLFSFQVKPGNIRVLPERGGGPVFDIGIYCINAARYIFQDEPTEVVALSESAAGDERFTEVDEMTSAILRFPQNRLATFTCGFGAASIDEYEVIGTKGRLRLNPCYEYRAALKHYLTIAEETKEKEFEKRDQFAAEAQYFSDCILENREPEPDGAEGMADMQVIEAIHKSAASGGHPVKLVPFVRERERPNPRQKIKRPPVDEPEPVKADAPHE